jgi:23S rRNA U2552 (ribose-2'-O)-methylase RlmE/FtsJ
MNKNHVLYTHPIVGDITFKDLIQDLNIIINDLSLFQSIISDMLGNLTELSDEDISSLLDYIPIDKLNWILDLLKSSSEK